MRFFAKPFPHLWILVLIMLAGCGGSGEADETSRSGLPQEIVIGAAIAKTGILAPYDSSIAAVEQLIDETNAQGGIEGHRLRLTQADTRSDPQQAVVAAQQVVEEGADVLLVTCDVSAAVASAGVAEENNELNFTLCENAPGFGPPYTSRLSFSANPSLLGEASAGERAHSLASEAVRMVALQRRRLRSEEQGDQEFVFRRWADFQFLVISLHRLRLAGLLAAKSKRGETAE
jgi:hypothetical protein